ncbi:MAG: class I SAM-dependent methyltransferase [Chitinivibrionales bacterium]|nr:class I SAM-dependent methyltransferase [Chitinivibrionales bacterium]
MKTSISQLVHRYKRKIQYFGFARYCPVCNSWVRRFGEYGRKKRRDAQCPVCKTLERHRFLWQFIKKNTTLLKKSPKKLLHFAPEPTFVSKFQKIQGLDYVTADLYDPKAMLAMDITKIEYPDESVDFFYCSHVLEHIEDDAKAISEIYRVLKKKGYAIILVPIMAEKTFEDPSVTDPVERERLFGQHDHVRLYGPDFKDRLVAAGFEVADYYIENMFSKKEIERLGLQYIPSNHMPIYLCEKN